jgi:hypothetical protein
MFNNLDIFDVIFSIQEKITDNDFIQLNNHIKKLIDYNNSLKTNNDYNYYNDNYNDDDNYNINNIKDKITDDEFINLNDKINKIIYEIDELISNDNFYDYYNDNIYYEDNTFIRIEQTNTVCRCCETWIYPNIENCNYINNFCLNSNEELIKCENFNKLLKDIPLLKNLFEKQDLKFTEESIDKDYDKQYIYMIIKILLNFIENLTIKKDKIIIFYIMYDFLLKNIRFLIDNKIFTINVLNKLNEFIKDSDFILYANEFSINYNIWIEIIKNILPNYASQ